MLGTRFGRDLQRLFDRLTRTHDKAYPVIVLEAADESVDVGAYLDVLTDAARDAMIPSTVVGAENDAEDAELTLLDQVSQERAWREIRPQAGRFRFPRSDLVRSFEVAVRNAREPGREPAVRAWNEAAPQFPWSRGPFRAPAWLRGLALVALALISGGILAGTPTSDLLAAGGALLVVAAVLIGLWSRQLWLPVLSRIGFGTRYRWFATSSFFKVLGGTGFYDRMDRVFARLVTRDPTEFAVQMKAFALFEDLRAEHRKLTPSLRGFKRPTVPVLFISGITQANGGIDLLAAMSDIRSRRSELYPLLVIASVDHEHRDELDRLVPPDPDGTDSVEDRYEDWEAQLGTAQGPSQQVALPYLLRLPIPGERHERQRLEPLRRRRRPLWTWLWSRRSLAAAMVVVLIGGLLLHRDLTSRYCRVDLLFHANRDTRLSTDVAGSHECVGVATGGLRFERGPLSMGMDGNMRAPDDQANHGAHITLADLQSLIDAEDRSVTGSHSPYVTILYAGMLTAAEGSEQSAVSSIRQLAGAYLAQMRNNHNDQPGEVGHPLKVRLLPVNTGENMDFSVEAADLMLAEARHDPTIVGVVGMGRNTDTSQRAIQRLSDAGLAVIGTSNSGDLLPKLPHYYGIASTDHDEAVAARYAADQAFGSRRVRGLIVSRDASRDPGRSRDLYGEEQTRDVRQELGGRYDLSSVTYRANDNITEKIGAECRRTRYKLVYFGGRTEDLRGLFDGLRAGGCTNDRLTLIGGDEVARTTFGSGDHQVPLPHNVTVYHMIFTHLPDLSATSNNTFVTLTRRLLGQPLPTLGDGQMAVTFDATAALAEAAQAVYVDLSPGHDGSAVVPGSRAVTSGSVLTELPKLQWGGGVTGTIDFTNGNEHALNGAGNRGLTLVRVTMSGSASESTPICGRANGGGPVPGMRPC